MAISEEEAAKLVEAILAAISKQDPQPGRDAIVDFLAQWRAEVEAGRPTDRRLRVREAQDSDGGTPSTGPRPTSTGEFVGKQEFRKVEQLDMLLEALGLAYVVPHLMADRIVQSIALDPRIDSSGTRVSVAFEPAGGAGDARRRIDRGTIDGEVEATARLSRLIDELSREAGLKERPIASYDLSL